MAHIINELALIDEINRRLSVAYSLEQTTTKVPVEFLERVKAAIAPPAKDTTEDFDSRFQQFMEGAQRIIDEYVERQITANPEKDPKNVRAAYGKTLDYSSGRRYHRVLVRGLYEREGSAFCFVDKKTGDVLKAASWKAPAKGARGNIYNDDFGLGRITPYGAEYNR